MDFEIKECFINPANHNNWNNTPLGIPSIDSATLSYSEFFENFMLKNQPCIIKNIANNWISTQKWVQNGTPNIQYLLEKYQHNKVIIYNCSERYFNSQKCSESTLADYVKLSNDDKKYYLKDWHLQLQSPDDDFYDVPIYFASDWLNEYFIECSDDDYRFVYVGQNGTWTPLHADVFNSFSWSVNICGRKKWIFFPPTEEQHLKDPFNNLKYDINETPNSAQSFEIIQNPGEAVFVPSTWFHQVWNLEDTISINHNWVNGCNLMTIWNNLEVNLQLTKKEIEDCRDMEGFDEHCQVMLKAHFGMDYGQFYDFLKFIGNRRLSMLQDEGSRILFHGRKLGVNHVIFDLVCICKVLKVFLKSEDVIKGKNFIEGQSLFDTIVYNLQNRNISYE